MVWSNKTVRKKHYSAERLQLDTPARLANTEEPCCSCHNLSRCVKRLHRELPLYFTQVLGEQAWVRSKYTGNRDLTFENTKLLVKLISPETANIKNIFHQKTLLYTTVVRDRNNVETKENQLLVSKDGCDMLSISPRAFNSSICILTSSGHPMFPLQPS